VLTEEPIGTPILREQNSMWRCLKESHERENKKKSVPSEEQGSKQLSARGRKKGHFGHNVNPEFKRGKKRA